MERIEPDTRVCLWVHYSLYNLVRILDYSLSPWAFSYFVILRTFGQISNIHVYSILHKLHHLEELSLEVVGF